jgi:hypothetical protein
MQKLSLFLIKQHFHKSIWKSGGVTPRILNFGSGGECLALLNAAFLPATVPSVTGEWESKRSSELIWKQDVYVKWTEIAADAVRV